MRAFGSCLKRFIERIMLGLSSRSSPSLLLLSWYWMRSFDGEGIAVLDCRTRFVWLRWLLILSLIALSSFLQTTFDLFLFISFTFSRLLLTTDLRDGCMEPDLRWRGSELKKSRGKAPWLLTIDGYNFFIARRFIVLLKNF